MDVRNGQYRATCTDGTGLGSTPGNEGWSGREGQPTGPSGIEVRLTLRGSCWFEETPAGLAVAGGAWARTSLDFK